MKHKTDLDQVFTSIVIAMMIVLTIICIINLPEIIEVISKEGLING